MSNAVFPSLPGQAWPRLRTVQFATEMQTSSSMRKWALSRSLYPLYDITLNFNFLRLADHVTLRSFFEAHLGRGDTFLFDDRDDRLQNDSATPQVFGVGDGTKTRWSLVRAQGGRIMPIGRHNTIIQVRRAAVATTAYTVDDYGVITFATAPADGAVLDWTGSFYWRCRFDSDKFDSKEFLRSIWDAKSLKFSTDKP
jgi:uncharacterized protein (TIGR02217 family)